MKTRKETAVIKWSPLTKQGKEYITQDTEYKEANLISVKDNDDTWELNTDMGSILCPKREKYTPQAGQIVRFYGKGFGYTVRGISIEDVIFYYRTPEEAAADHAAWCKAEEDKKKAVFKKEKKNMDAVFNALPPVFQQRVERFRQGNPDFRWEFEAYELFCCTEAIKIAEKFKTVAAIDNFRQMPVDAQMKMVNMSNGHSGNTFGCATLLAKLYVSEPELVVKLHGALTPLVGCEAYGCRLYT